MAEIYALGFSLGARQGHIFPLKSGEYPAQPLFGVFGHNFAQKPLVPQPNPKGGTDTERCEPKVRWREGSPLAGSPLEPQPSWRRFPS